MPERSFRLLTACVVFLIILGGVRFSRAAESDSSKTGTVELKVVGPDGQPLAHVQLAMRSTQRFPPGGEKRWSAQAKTDDQGVARFPLRVGIAQIEVTAGDIGYGTTGLFEVSPGTAVRAPLPRLAPFAHVGGQIPPQFAGEKDVTVNFRGSYRPDDPISVAVGSDRRFAVSLRAGSYFVFASSGSKHIAQTSVNLGPGQVVDALPLAALPQLSAATTQSNVTALERPAVETMVWAEGSVRDENGKPVPDANVYADAIYFGGMRMQEIIQKTTTDQQGHYSIKGRAGLLNFSATVVANKAGMTSAFSSISLPGPQFAEVPPGANAPTKRMATPAPRHRDFVLSPHGGSLRVTVHADGKPLAGAQVLLIREGGMLNQTWARTSNRTVREELQNVVYPRRTADVAGVTEFDNLVPGQYELVAARGSDPDIRGLFRGEAPTISEARSPVAEAHGIPVVMDQLREFHLAFSPSNASVRFRVLDEHGAPRTGRVGIEWTTLPHGSLSSAVDLNKNGFCSLNHSIGIARFSFRYRNSPVEWIPLGEPCFDASAMAAVSPLLPAEEQISLRAMRVDPGSIHVQLIGLDGRPARGAVTLGRIYVDPIMATSTDDAGMAQFDAVPSGSYILMGYLSGHSEINVPFDKDGSVPGDEQLANCISFIPYAVVATANQVTKVTLRARRAGFIRGRVIAANGTLPPNLSLYVIAPESGDEVQRWLRPVQGDFVIGPLASGKVTIHAMVFDHDGPHSVSELITDAVEGQIKHLDFQLSPAAARGSKSSIKKEDGASNEAADEESLRGHVVLSDGKTLADGAMVLYIPRGESRPKMEAIADALGSLTAHESLRFGNGPFAEAMGSPTHDVLVAILPGQCGATIQEIDGLPKDPLRLILPKANHVNGRVHIGGKAPTGLGQLLVRAQYQGKGKLDDFLSMSVTPQVDGTFELNGLTPGTYQVQASLDGIWLSATQKLVVGDGDLADMTLDIAEPAGPVCVELVDVKGQPLRGRKVTVDRPPGPLTSALWPDTFLSDGAGHAWIPPLEAGRHTIHVPGSSAIAKATAPALETGKAAVVRIEVKDVP